MRLTCPNCGAQYEVPDDVIPEEGRDVQCSNCGDTWFQQAAGHVPAPDAEAGEPAAVAADAAQEQPPTTPSVSPADHEGSEPEPVAADQAVDQGAEVEFATDPDQEAAAFFEGATPEAAEAHVPDPEADGFVTQEQPVTTPTAEPDTTPSPRGLDPALSDILREEAEREAGLRAADQGQSQSLETQPNLGLDDLPENEEARRSRQTKDRMARIRGEDPRLLAAEASGLKRGVLPDIEEINSTLRAADSPPPPTPEAMAPPPRKSGFTRGFALALLVVLALLMVYSNAPQIAEILPQADPYLSSYVTWVDQMRLWLDTQVTALQNTPI
ncbi:zinc-ribbon domain-containing protein [Pseudophaeobacter sp. EL27]|uniref:zinc-ribbon domain-containing protein n=1 Tax=Pseudophaeobacter sp. EL27 TaxID=2107580 RepID=UPI000EFA5135|nr:zinc-ribbon domain-containing protein [Pseudophaeobacter sp. EL27]